MGQHKSLGGLSFAQIEAAGHMVPLDNPAPVMGIVSKMVDEIVAERR